MSKRLRIRNWDKFQHYSQRNPPWIKLYRILLDDKNWYDLSGDSAKGLIMLWLIAAEDEGRLPDVKTLAFRLRISENRVSALLADCSEWLEEDASTLLASCYQDARPETETETEERRGEKRRREKIFVSDQKAVEKGSAYVEEIRVRAKREGWA